jgi:hypothetical protein
MTHAIDAQKQIVEPIGRTNNTDPLPPKHVAIGRGASMTQPLRLYFVDAQTEDGERLDLFVWSETLHGVADHWRSYYELNADEQPDRIFEISTAAPRPGPVRWHAPGHVCSVFGD